MQDVPNTDELLHAILNNFRDRKEKKFIIRNTTYILFIGFVYMVRIESIHHHGLVQNKGQAVCNEISECTYMFT